MADDERGTDGGESADPGAEEPASLDGFDPDGADDSSDADDGTGGFQFGGTDDSSAADAADDAESADAPDADDAGEASVDLEDDPTADESGADDDGASGPVMSPFAGGTSDGMVDADGATDEAIASALADVELDEPSQPSLGTDGGALAGTGDVAPALGPDGPGEAAGGSGPPRVSTAVEDPGSVDARFVVACPVCEYVAGDDELLPVATARAKHAAHAGDDHVPRWVRTEELVTPATFMITEVRTVACADCGTERWIADRATAREFADDHGTYTTHDAVAVTTRSVEAPSPEGLLAVVVALTDPPGGTSDAGDGPVPGVEAAVVEDAFVDGALDAFEPDEDRDALAARTARAVEWRLRRLREHGRLEVEGAPDDGAERDRRLLRVTDRGREVVESTVPGDGLGELSVGAD